MKNVIFFLAFLCLLQHSVWGQEYNRTTYPEGSETPMLIGACNRDAFALPEFQSWFDKEYESYVPDGAFMSALKDMSIENLSFTIVLGTWCPDSRREVPRFFRIIDDLGIPDEQIRMLSLDRNKSIPGEDISELKVYFVPTFILHRNGIELGRIVEMPENTIEADILDMLN